MAMFEAPGWDISGASIVADFSTPKKRKRPNNAASLLETEDRQVPEVNIDRLMKKMRLSRNNTEDMSIGLDKKEQPTGAVKKRERLKRKKRGDSSMSIATDIDQANRDQTGPTDSQGSQSQVHGRQKRVKKVDTHPMEAQIAVPRISSDFATSTSSTLTGPRTQAELAEKKRKKKKRVDIGSEIGPIPDDASNIPEMKGSSNLTPMQAAMKHKLDGGRFRYINEIFYKSDSKRALDMLHDDPKVYEEYHVGFRQQVLSWPTNPVTHYIDHIQSSVEPRSVIVDLGCGDAALAKALIPKGYYVLSYDLVSVNEYVVEADICIKVPLPGGESGGKIVDVALCSLSLMSTNWLGCIKEAKRILKGSGELWIAEVTSRFKNIDAFVNIVSSLGFELISKEEPTTHFVLFAFKSRGMTADKHKPKDWTALLKKSQEFLKPCEYKRR